MRFPRPFVVATPAPSRRGTEAISKHCERRVGSLASSRRSVWPRLSSPTDPWVSSSRPGADHLPRGPTGYRPADAFPTVQIRPAFCRRRPSSATQLSPTGRVDDARPAGAAPRLPLLTPPPPNLPYSYNIAAEAALDTFDPSLLNQAGAGRGGLAEQLADASSSGLHQGQRPEHAAHVAGIEARRPGGLRHQLRLGGRGSRARTIVTTNDTMYVDDQFLGARTSSPARGNLARPSGVGGTLAGLRTPTPVQGAQRWPFSPDRSPSIFADSRFLNVGRRPPALARSVQANPCYSLAGVDACHGRHSTRRRTPSITTPVEDYSRHQPQGPDSYLLPARRGPSGPAATSRGRSRRRSQKPGT